MDGLTFAVKPGILTAVAMGTAAGDLVACTANLGFLQVGLLFAALCLLPGIAYRYLNLNAILTFWFAGVMTRSLGVSFADWMSKPRYAGGLGWGDGPVSLTLSSPVSLSSDLRPGLRIGSRGG